MRKRPSIRYPLWSRFLLCQLPMDRNPDAGWIRACVFHAVSLMGRNEKMVARAQFQGPAVFKGQDGVALEKDDLFVPFLLVPSPGRGGLAGGDDAFDEHTAIGNKAGELLFIPDTGR